jgi:uncharacterized protein YfaS (alpha-2-macroglobulin family)
MWYRTFIVIILSSFLVFGANVLFINHPDFTPRLGGEPSLKWKVFDSLLQVNQPNAAREQLDAILHNGIENENHPDISKAVGSYIQTIYSMEPNERKNLFVRIDSISNQLNEPSKSISKLLLIDQMLQSSRQWFSYGVNVDPIVFQKDTLVMSEQQDRITYVINNMESLETDLDGLSAYNFSSYSFLVPNEKEAKEFFPNLFDYSVAKLIGDYKNYEVRRYHEWKVSGTPQENWFSNPTDFVNDKFKDHSLHHKVLSLFQQWEKSHLKDFSRLSMVHYNRLKYIFEEENYGAQQKVWQEGYQFYGSSNARSKFLYEKVRLIYQKGKKYHFKIYQESEKDLLKAHGLLEAELEAMPENDFKNQIELLIRLIEQEKASFSMQNIAYPGDLLPIKFQHQNLDSVKLYIYKKPKQHPRNKSLRDCILDKNYKLIRESSFTLEDKGDFQMRSTSNLLDPITEPGDYHFLLINTEDNLNDALKTDSTWRNFDKANHSLKLSEIMVNTEKDKDGIRFLVTNYKNGEPVKGANVQVYFNRRIDLGFPNRSGMTNEDGVFHAAVENENMQYEVSFNGSYISSSDYIYDYSREEPDYTVKVLTDRAIYRPGQTVHYKTIAYTGENNDYTVADNEKVRLVIRNSSYDILEEKELMTNEFGSANGSFTLPLGGPFGRFEMNASVKGEENYNNRHSFRVEEYKRPTFETSIDYPKDEAKLNDSVLVTGIANAFAGYPITGAKVKFKVYRNWNTYWYYYGNNNNRDLIIDSLMKSDENGNFDISFFAKTDPNAPENAQYQFEVIADVTDISGETHGARINLNLTKTGLRLDFSATTQLDFTNEEYGIFNVVNMAGEPQEGFKGKMNLYQIVPEDRFLSRIWPDAEFKSFDSEDWKKLFPYAGLSSYSDESLREEKITSLDFAVGDSIDLVKLLKDKQGAFIIKSYVVTKSGDTLRNQKKISTIDLKATTIPEQVELWTHLEKSNIEVGEKAKVHFGTAFKKAQALVELWRGEDLLRSEWMDLSKRKSMEHFATEEDRGGLTFSISMVYDGEIYTKTQHVIIPFSNKKLKIEASTFRDELLPGQQEEWRFTISGEGADELASEICAGMYDASLDQFAANYWALWPYRSNYHYNDMRTAVSKYVQNNSGNAGWSDQSYFLRNYYASPLDLISYRWGGANFAYQSQRVSGGKMYKKTNSLANDMVEESEQRSGEGYGMDSRAEVFADADQPALEDKSEKDESISRGDNKSAENKETVQIRENFNETAFFYPDLKTNAKGEFVVSFKLPESLTEWKFMALAHTKDMKTGQLNLSAVAKKPLMVTSNAPRFFRTGDQFDFASKVVNQSDSVQEVEVEIHFFDPSNDEVIQLIGRQPKTKMVTVKPGSAQDVTWNLDLSNQEGIIAYRITAKNEAFSDGEQKAIPVLTNRQLVIESMPFVLPKGGVEVINFESMLSNNSKSLVNERFTFEYTANPSWNAVLALPYLADFPYECAEQVFSRYYANLLAANVIAGKPKIKAMFEEWRNYSPEVFMSQLEKNDELKTILLEETPWVLDAQSESERKRRIAELFEVNQLARNQEQALHLLSKKQNSDGGFGWFGGNRSNIFITQHIVAGFGHLKQLGIDVPDKADRMVERALDFLDRHYQRQYNRLTKKQKESMGISSSVLHWLYASSYFDAPHDKVDKEVIEFHTGKLRKYWSSLGLQQQAMAGIYFNRIDDNKFKEQVLASFRDRAKRKEKKGMYFPENNGGYYWHQAKIETHAMITEFFIDAGGSKSEVDNLRLWLLLNKRSNAWENTKATALATYVLLMNGTDYLGDQSLPEIKVGGTKLVYNTQARDGERSVEVTPGLGYFQTSWTKEDVNQNLAKVEISKTTDAPSYGSLYWKYFEDMSKVKASSNADIQIKRSYKKIVAGAKGNEFVEVKEYQVGDRIRVELVVSVEQDLEFVHLKDLRPAGCEPMMALSQHKWNKGLWYYQSPKDVSMNYFIDNMPKGTHVLTYEMYVTSSGQFEAGNATVQCMYAPEFTAHSKGEKIYVKQ